MTARPDRRVRRLRLRSASGEDARRAATLLADALHTASLPGSGRGRLLAIRRLALGRISPRASGAALALHIERIVRDVVTEAVAYDLPSAGESNAVWFPERGEALAELARLHAAGEAHEQWFWPRVAPGWERPLSRADRWRLLLDAAHDGPESAVVAAAVVRQAMRAGVEDELLASIPPGEGARWLWLEGWSSLDAVVPVSSEPFSPLRRTPVFARWIPQWGAADARLIWLGAALAVGEQPLRAADPVLPARIAAALADARLPDTLPDEGAAPAPPVASARAISPPDDRATVPEHLSLLPEASDGLEPIAAPASEEEQCAHLGVVAAGPPTAAPEPPQPRSEAGPARATLLPAPSGTVRQYEPTMRPAAGEDVSPHKLPQVGTFTSCAGLFFAVPILDRLGFAAFLAAHPDYLEAGFPARLLRRIGLRAGLKATDPLARQLLENQPGASERVLDFAFDDLPAPAREILSAPAPRSPVDSPETAWLAAVRRWCRRHPRMGLRNLLRRPGRVAISRTHIDVTFAFDQVDIRVRRLGLDIDPGWVPWLAHVIRFHYIDEDGPAY